MFGLVFKNGVLGVVLLKVEVEPVSEHVTDSDRRSELERGSRMVLREANGVHLQGESEEEWVSLSLHLG